jgi:pimeloyl-ACP methyl ester carboxylesterase
MPTKYAQVAGHPTYYYYVGATTTPDVVPDFSRGKTIVLVHAAGSNGHSWHNQVDGLGAKHSPIAMDMPGHARSDGVVGFETIAQYTDFLAAFLDALKIKSAVIAGRSMGGAVAMDFAIRYPERTQALIAMCTAAKFNIPAERLGALEAVAKGRASQQFTNDGYSPRTIKENVDVIREGWGEQVRTDPRVRWTDVKACAGVDLTADLGKIKKPVLVLAGADDVATTPADAEVIAERIAGAKLVKIADAAHKLPTERPAELNADIEKFLSQL